MEDPLSAARRPPVTEESCGVVSVLPLLYVAWADGVLTPSQLKEIRTRIAEQPWLSAEDKQTLAGWLDPADPPSPVAYHGWRQALQMAAGHVPAEKRHSLPDLGAALARVAGADDDDSFSTPEACDALAEMEHLLGVVTPEAMRDVLEERPAPPRRSDGDGEGHAERSFPVAAMTQLLDAPHGDLRRKIRTLLCDPAFAYASDDLSVAEYRDWVLEKCRLLAEQGLGALAYPEEYGGNGDLAAFIAAFETLAHHDLSVVVKFGVQFGLFGGSIQQLGTSTHHQAYLPQVGALALPGCFAMSELGHGSNVRELETTATYDASTEEFVIDTPSESARKEWIGGAARHGRMATVFAQLRVGSQDGSQDGGQEHGVHAFLVPIRDEDGEVLDGVHIEDNGRKMGLNGVDNGRIWFDAVRIPRENLLDRFAQVSADGAYASDIPSSGKRFFTMLSTLVGGRISVAAAGLSAAKSALTIAVRYGAQRRQFGPKGAPERPVLDYRTHQRRLLPLLADAYALDFAIGDVAERFASRQAGGADLRRVEGEAAALKALSTWNTTRTVQTARECCGGQGYLAANRLPQLKADTDVFTTFEGDNTVLMLQVAKGLLSEFQQELQDMNFFGLARFIAEAAAQRVMKRNPLHGRETSSEHLRDAGFQQDAFAFRERALLQSVAQRLKRRLDDGMDSFDAFVECQDHLLSLAQAHAERLALNAFTEGVERCESEKLKPVLAKLRALYALARLEDGVGWFQEKHYVEAGQAHAIRREVNALCAELRPLAVDLVDAFAIPDEVLAAPIATGETVTVA